MFIHLYSIKSYSQINRKGLSYEDIRRSIGGNVYKLLKRYKETQSLKKKILAIFYIKAVKSTQQQEIIEK